MVLVVVLILDILGQSWLSIVEVETEKSDLHLTIPYSVHNGVIRVAGV